VVAVLVDIWVNVVSLLYKPSKQPESRAPRQAPPALATPALPLSDWERVLYVGTVDNGRHAPPHPSKARADEPRAFTAWTSSLRESEPTFEGERSVATRD
jgi:hypothetical protein